MQQFFALGQALANNAQHHDTLRTGPRLMSLVLNTVMERAGLAQTRLPTVLRDKVMVRLNPKPGTPGASG